jgi:hypothetical protein
LNRTIRALVKTAVEHARLLKPHTAKNGAGTWRLGGSVVNSARRSLLNLARGSWRD